MPSVEGEAGWDYPFEAGPDRRRSKWGFALKQDQRAGAEACSVWTLLGPKRRPPNLLRSTRRDACAAASSREDQKARSSGKRVQQTTIIKGEIYAAGVIRPLLLLGWTIECLGLQRAVIKAYTPSTPAATKIGFRRCPWCRGTGCHRCQPRFRNPQIPVARSCVAAKCLIARGFRTFLAASTSTMAI